MTITKAERRRLVAGTNQDNLARPTFERSGVLSSLLGMLAGLGMLAFVSVVLAGSAILLDLEFELVSAEGDLQLLSVIALSIEAIILIVSALVGGFVAGRLARHNGMLVGLGSGLWLTAVMAILGGLALWIGAVTDVLAEFDLSTRLSAVDTIGVATAAAITGGGLLVLVLLGGVLGGRWGQTEDKPVESTVVDLSDANANGEIATEETRAEDVRTEDAPTSV